MQNYINDMLIRIKNGQNAQLDAIILHPYMPKVCYNVLDVLYAEGYICGYNINNKKKGIKVLLKYQATGVGAIANIYSVSTAGRRVYVTLKTLWKLKNGSGSYILSTSKGLMLDRDARFFGLGGELLCVII